MVDILNAKKKLAVNVKSEQEAFDFLEWLRSKGVEIFGMDKRVSEHWATYGEDLCYNVEGSGMRNELQVGWCYKEWYKQEGFVVIEADRVDGFCEDLPDPYEDSDSFLNFLFETIGISSLTDKE